VVLRFALLLPVPVLVTPVLTLLLPLVLPVPFGMEREAEYPSILAVALRSATAFLLAIRAAVASWQGIRPLARIALCAALAPRIRRNLAPSSELRMFL